MTLFFGICFILYSRDFNVFYDPRLHLRLTTFYPQPTTMDDLPVASLLAVSECIVGSLGDKQPTIYIIFTQDTTIGPKIQSLPLPGKPYFAWKYGTKE